MATEDIVFKVSVDGDGSGGKSLSSLKKEFKELQKELEKAKVGSTEYQQALQKLGATKDEIGLLNQQINTLADDAGQIKAIGSVVNGLAGGFAAAQGAAALFGAQSEELEKTLLKVQAALALQQGISAVMNLKDAFVVLGTTLAANPIFAIVGVVAALSAGIVAVTQDTSNYEEAQKTLNNTIETAKQRQDEYNNALFETQLEIDVLNGKITEQQAKISKLERQSGVERTKIAKDYAKQILKLAEDLGIELEVLRIDQKTKEVYADLEAAGNQLNTRIYFNEEVKKIQQQANEDAILIQASFNQRSKLENLKAKKEESNAIKEQFNNTIIEELEARQAIVSLYTYNEGEIVAQTEQKKRTEAQKTADLKEMLAKKIAEREAAEAKIRLDIDQNYFNAIGSLSSVYFNTQMAQAQGNAKAQEDLRQRQFKVEKAFRASQAAIDTYKAINATLAVGGPLAIPLSVSIGIAGFANVAKILSQQYQGGGVGWNQSINIQAPQQQTSAPQPVTTPLTRLNEQGQNLTRAYVVETDITDSQRRINRLAEQATFG